MQMRADTDAGHGFPLPDSKDLGSAGRLAPPLITLWGLRTLHTLADGDVRPRQSKQTYSPYCY